MSHPKKVVKQLFGSADKIPNILREVREINDNQRTKNRKISIKKKGREDLIKRLIELLENNRISQTPYTNELWTEVKQSNRLLAT
ncbi:MAG: hypothetical protein AB1779_10460 [Candidatus Thermoplasmatota archaeon]